jgi:K+-transporting ATPase KdpF subunit
MVKIAFERESPDPARIKDSTIGIEKMRHIYDRVALAGVQDHVGYRLCRGKHIVFLHRDWIRHRLRPAWREGDAEMIETLALGLVTVALLVYLVYALLRPEKF